MEQLPIPGGAISTSDALVAMRSASGLHPVGRLTDASNATFLCELEGVEPALQVIYKPIRGERPLWDFPEGTLAGREVAAFEVSEALGLRVVPPTILRDGPAGEGAVQLWIEHLGVEIAIAAVNEADASLRPIALFDAIINNGDRKAGHLLPIRTDRYLGVDHGVTFATEPKLRTVLWEWRSQALNESELSALRAGTSALDSNDPGGLNERLAALITAEERDLLRARVAELLEHGTFPEPSPDWPPLPWPLI